MAFIDILFISALYLFVVVLDGIPRASGFFGHMIGVLGFVLMLMTETLYFLRKHSRRARWGRMVDWLDFHILPELSGHSWSCCILPGNLTDWPVSSCC